MPSDVSSWRAALPFAGDGTRYSRYLLTVTCVDSRHAVPKEDCNDPEEEQLVDGTELAQLSERNDPETEQLVDGTELEQVSGRDESADLDGPPRSDHRNTPGSGAVEV